MTDESATLPHALVADAQRVLPDLIAIRRRLHQHPEVGLQLPWTSAAVAEEVRALGLEPSIGRSVGSVVAVIEGGRPGPTVLLRADMDGLPLHEDTGLPFASAVEGTMHACGHDTHMTMLLGGARLLLERRAELPGRVLLMFQPGEEGYHGAREMLREGLLDAVEGPVTGAFAIHITTSYRSGVVALRPGALLAAGDTLHIRVVGRGGHASAPHRALDPIAVAAELLVSLQSMITRRIDAFDPAVLTIAHIEGGTTSNVIPESVLLEGTMRTVSPGTRELAREEVRRVVDGVAATTGATIELDIVPGYPVTSNDPAMAALVADVAVEIGGPEAYLEMPAPIMGSEDFSYVLEQVPGAMAFLGACPPDIDPASAPANHSNLVAFDEPAMAMGAALYAAVALRMLQQGPEDRSR
jgi:amidohydrolase